MIAGLPPARLFGRRLHQMATLSLCLVLSTCITAPTETQDVTFRLGVVGDQTGTRDLERSYMELEKGVHQLKRLDLDAVIHVGDLLESAKPVVEMRNDFERSTAILDQLPVPWYLTAGDHDVNPPERLSNSSDRSREALFLELYRRKNPAIDERPYYAVNVDGWQLISLFSHDQLHTDPRWGNIFFAHVSDEQYDWLADTLESRDAGSKGTIVFVHQPLWYNWGDWADVHEILAAYGVRAVIAGHFHYSQDEGELDGIRYLVHGATGGRIKGTQATFGGAHIVSALEFSEDDIVIRSVTTDGVPLEGFPQRKLMDRVQALDVALGSLSASIAQTTVFRRVDGTLVQSCTHPDVTIELPLERLGNPIDQPVVLSLDPPILEELDLGFKGPGCSTRTCRIEPGQGVVVSNLASVRFSSSDGEIPQLTVQGVSADDGLRFSLVMSATISGINVKLEDKIEILIANCLG